MRVSASLSVLVASLLLSFSARATDNSRYVNPFLGVDTSGNTFCGAALPFSMVKLGPDMYMPSRWTSTNSGYSTGKPVRGFSHTHVSGTGGGAKYGHFAVMPMTGSPNRRDYSSTISAETSEPGFYSGILDSENVLCELTLTSSVGFHRYSAIDGKPLTLYIDACSMLDKGATPQHALDSGIEIVSDTEVQGYLNCEGGWNVGAPFKVFFYAVCSEPIAECGTFRDGRMAPGNRKEWSVNRNDHTIKAAWLSFKESKVELRMAISYVSIEKAKRNYIQQAQSITFDSAKQEARRLWNTYLDRLEVKGPQQVLTTIYTGLYRSLLMPVDRTGEMPLWGADEAYADDYYAIWDTFRTVSPLLAIISPESIERQITALLNIADHEDGLLLDARSGNSNGLVQGGSNADMLIADAVSKGITGFDVRKAFDYMLKGARTEPVNPRNIGRGGALEYNSLGYVPSEVERSCSRTVEYAACDAAIARVARYLGEETLALQYERASCSWKNLWNADASDSGFRGFIVPRSRNGEFENQNLLSLGLWSAPYYEGNSWQYSLYVPHDVPGLIDACGGKDAFVSRLDYFFSKGLDEGDRHYYNVGNEPSFLTPFLYSWAGRPDRTCEVSRKILSTCFGTSRSGLPGNDDSGAMSSWAAFVSLGFFPVAGSDKYVLASPCIDEAVFHLRKGNTFTIKVRRGSESDIHVQSVKMNGKTVKSGFLSHSFISNGGVLEFRMK